MRARNGVRKLVAVGSSVNMEKNGPGVSSLGMCSLVARYPAIQMSSVRKQSRCGLESSSTSLKKLRR